MINSKYTGSYYTPKYLSDFLVSHLFEKFINKTDLAILEPSCGDGQFVESLLNLSDLNKINTIDIVDIDKDEINKALARVPRLTKVKVNAICNDFLLEYLEKPKKYDVIIGNPPYIRRRNMTNDQRLICDRCLSKSKLLVDGKMSSVNNIWAVFLDVAINSLEDNGIICLVLPAEVLQVEYAKHSRKSIKEHFDIVEIFAFDEQVFKGIQQDVVCIIAAKKPRFPVRKEIIFYRVDKIDGLKGPLFTEMHSNTNRLTLNKWTNYLLSESDLELIDDLKRDLKPISSFCERISAGIVTAANDFFILNNSSIQSFGLDQDRHFKKILLKSSFLKSPITFELSDLQKLISDDERVYFLYPSNEDKVSIDGNLKNYIAHGEIEHQYHKRFKTKSRAVWFDVPNTWNSEILFAKRTDNVPKLILNSANVKATDSFYRVIPKQKFKAKNIIFSFYNSLTLLLTEMEGRYYGGGVLELTPNEFKNIPIPYNAHISNYQFEKLDGMFRNKATINDILDYTDSILFPSVSKESISDIRKFRELLTDRRKKKPRPISKVENPEESELNIAI